MKKIIAYMMCIATLSVNVYAKEVVTKREYYNTPRFSIDTYEVNRNTREVIAKKGIYYSSRFSINTYGIVSNNREVIPNRNIYYSSRFSIDTYNVNKNTVYTVPNKSFYYSSKFTIGSEYAVDYLLNNVSQLSDFQVVKSDIFKVYGNYGATLGSKIKTISLSVNDQLNNSVISKSGVVLTNGVLDETIDLSSFNFNDTYTVSIDIKLTDGTNIQSKSPEFKVIDVSSLAGIKSPIQYMINKDSIDIEFFVKQDVKFNTFDIELIDIDTNNKKCYTGLLETSYKTNSINGINTYKVTLDLDTKNAKTMKIALKLH